MSLKYEKDNLTSKFSKSTFPEKLIEKDCLKHKNILFNEQADIPINVLNDNKPINLKDSYFFEENADLKKKQRHGHNNRNYQNKDWKKSEEDKEVMDFFDDFKGRSNPQKVVNFFKEKRNADLKTVNTNNFCVINQEFINGNDLSKKLDVVTISETNVDSFFDDPDKFFNSNNTNVKKVEEALINPQPKKSEIPSEILPINITNIYLINKCLEYPKKYPLWYIFHPMAKSSFGPISSVNIEEMYKSKMINDETEIRLIDVYNIEGVKPFEFVKFKNVINNSITSKIQISNLMDVINTLGSPDKTKMKEKSENSVFNQK